MNNVISMNDARIRVDERGSAPAVASSRVQQLNLELEEWRLHGQETETSEHVATTVVPEASRLLQQARALFASVETTSDDSGSFGTRPDDIAYFALHEIANLERVLGNVDTSGPAWRMVEVCEQIRGQLMNAASALFRSLCARSGCVEVDDVQRREMERALRVRTRLAAFRAGLSEGARMAGEDMMRRMRLAGTALAVLVGSKEYEDFRLSDRLLVAALQRDILAWVVSTRRDSREAQRVWEDLLGFVELSRGVNRHVHLADHDEQLVTRLATSLAGRPSYEPLPPTLAPVVRELWGLHPRLDALIESEQPRTTGAWRDCIQEIRGDIATSAPPAADPFALAAATPA